MFKVINYKLLILAFIIGMFLDIKFNNSKQIVYKFPNPTNVKKVIYENGDGTCFKMDYKLVDCDENSIETPIISKN